MVRSWSADPQSVSEATLRSVLGAYFDASDIEGVGRVPQRVQNVNFRVRAAGASWVLKRHSSPRAAEQRRYSHALELMLIGAGFPVAELRRAKDGTTLVQSDADWYSLHAWVDGHHSSVRHRDSLFTRHAHLPADLGEIFSGYHLLTSHWVAPGDTREPVAIERLLLRPGQALTSIRRGRPPQLFMSQRLRFKRNKSDFDRWILERLTSLKNHTDRLESTAIDSRIDRSDIVMAHNDVNWENIIFDDQFNLAGLLDFDNSTPLVRSLDVGMIAAALIGPNEMWMSAFTNAYESTYGLELDRQLVQLGFNLRSLRSVLWSIDSYLRGRIADPVLVEEWCRAMYENLVSTSSSSGQMRPRVGREASVHALKIAGGSGIDRRRR